MCGEREGHWPGHMIIIRLLPGKQQMNNSIPQVSGKIASIANMNIMIEVHKVINNSKYHYGCRLSLVSMCQWWDTFA